MPIDEFLTSSQCLSISSMPNKSKQKTVYLSFNTASLVTEKQNYGFYLCCFRYNPYVQARNRIDQLKRLGHSVDKVEFILMGGTFMSLPTEYRDYFIRNCTMPCLDTPLRMSKKLLPTLNIVQ